MTQLHSEPRRFGRPMKFREVATVRCSVCYKPLGKLLLDSRAFRTAPDSDDIADYMSWSRAPRRCTCERPLPTVDQLAEATVPARARWSRDVRAGRKLGETTIRC